MRVGTLAQGGAVDPHSWPHSLRQELGQGTLSVGAADSIRAGIGEPSTGVSESDLAEAIGLLCAEAATLDADRLFRRARELRNELEGASIAESESESETETERRNARSLAITRLPDGMSRLTWLMDPETAAIATDLWDRATSPRRGGPRFVDAGSQDPERAKRIIDDHRSTVQLASDVFAELLRQGATADSFELLTSGTPVVHLLVLKSALDIGREHRLYTRKPRRALAIRDGGCMFPGCDRPPSWTEAHHTKHWRRDRGGTDIADGILLCRHHHLLCHNNHWEIQRVDDGFVLIPPVDVHRDQVPIPLPSKSAALRELRAAAS